MKKIKNNFVQQKFLSFWSRGGGVNEPLKSEFWFKSLHPFSLPVKNSPFSKPAGLFLTLINGQKHYQIKSMPRPAIFGNQEDRLITIQAEDSGLARPQNEAKPLPFPQNLSLNDPANYLKPAQSAELTVNFASLKRSLEITNQSGSKNIMITANYAN